MQDAVRVAPVVLFCWNGDRIAQFAQRLPDDDRGSLQCERGHDRGNYYVGPPCSGAKHAKGSEQHREIPDHVVTSANPR